MNLTILKGMKMCGYRRINTPWLREDTMAAGSEGAKCARLRPALSPKLHGVQSFKHGLALPHSTLSRTVNSNAQLHQDVRNKRQVTEIATTCTWLLKYWSLSCEVASNLVVYLNCGMQAVHQQTTSRGVNSTASTELLSTFTMVTLSGTIIIPGFLTSALDSSAK